MEFLNKKLILEGSLSNINKDRTYETDVVINGRHYTKKGKETATTFYIRVYKTSENIPLKRYLLNVGISRQHPADFKNNKELAEEVAGENCIVDPIISIWSTKCPTNESIETICKAYLSGMADHRFILTRDERNMNKAERDYNYFCDDKNRKFYFDIEFDDDHSQNVINI